MSNGSCHSQNHAEAVEHRHLYHHTVSCGEVHTVSDSLTVVNNIVVCEHYALGESCSTGSVLHIADIVDIDGLADCLHLGVRNVLGKCNCFFPCVASLVLGINSDNVLEEKEALQTGACPARRSQAQGRVP